MLWSSVECFCDVVTLRDFAPKFSDRDLLHGSPYGGFSKPDVSFPCLISQCGFCVSQTNPCMACRGDRARKKKSQPGRVGFLGKVVGRGHPQSAVFAFIDRHVCLGGNAVTVKVTALPTASKYN